MKKVSKKKIPAVILIVSAVLLFLIASISFLSNRDLYKLPGTVKTETIEVSSKASGFVKKINLFKSDYVEKGDLLLEIENPYLISEIEDLKIEKAKYDDLINSASGGNILNLKLTDLNENISVKQTKMIEISLKLKSSREENLILKEKYNITEKEYNASKKLYEKEVISSAEFDEKLSEYSLAKNRFTSLKNEISILKSEKNDLQKELDNLQTKIGMFSENVSLIEADYILDRIKIQTKLNRLERQKKALKIFANSNGYISGINVRIGEWIEDGETVIKILPLENIWVVAYGSAVDNKTVLKGMKAKVICSNKEEILGEVESISPIMDRVKSLAGTFETVHAYTKIKITFKDMKLALKNLTPGEKLVVVIYG